MTHKHVHIIHRDNEHKTLVVIWLTLITMIAEIAYGYITNSMALLADGYHMGTHALALGLTYVAYVLIRKFKNSEKFPNGTEKIGTLAAYTSSIFLGLTGLWIICEACSRFINPVQIQFNEAILIATIGLVINTVCIYVMENKNTEHFNEHDKNEDCNFKAAYYHILADAITSILAIVALLAGKFLHIVYLDSFVGIIGGLLILKWAGSLVKKTVKSLIDMI